uniref:SH2 domain-containing protein n=1 Tax=Globodera pallida TaxID=36090 RepID=A0A183C306_GLOPA
MIIKNVWEERGEGRAGVSPQGPPDRRRYEIYAPPFVSLREKEKVKVHQYFYIKYRIRLLYPQLKCVVEYHNKELLAIEESGEESDKSTEDHNYLDYLNFRRQTPAQQQETQRLAQEKENGRLLRVEAERKEKERVEAERKEKERVEAERKEKERVEAERKEKERLQRAEAERKEKARLQIENERKAKRQKWIEAGLKETERLRCA